MTTLLHYKAFLPEKENSRQRTPLIILHGLLGSMDNWRSQTKRLSEFRSVYTLDLRNHGNSPHLKGMSYREMYDDVIKVTNHLKIKQFHLLGHSMGGKVAMQLSLAHPSLVKSLIVVDIAPKPYPLWHQKTLQGVMNAPVEEMTSWQQIDEYLQPWIEDPGERTFMLKNLKRDGDHFKWRCNLEEISRGYLKIAGFSNAMATFPGRTLFIKGEQSNYIQEADKTIIKVLFPRSKIITIKQSGHLPHFQQADEFYKIVSDFLERT